MLGNDNIAIVFAPQECPCQACNQHQARWCISHADPLLESPTKNFMCDNCALGDAIVMFAAHGVDLEKFRAGFAKITPSELASTIERHAVKPVH
jgi:hypothetical protein